MWKEHDKSGKSTGFKGTMKIKSGSGKRLILNHFISEDGFIPEALDLFVGETGCGDYHKEMNGVHYNNYIKEILGPQLPDKTLLVIDKASYHSVMTEESRSPTKSWRKADILEWLRTRDISWPDGCNKAKLLEIVDRHKSPVQYVIDEDLKQIPHSTNVGEMKDIVVLRLPTKHCFFNPIELVWAWIKGYVARRNSSCKLKDVERLTREAIANIPSDYMRRCYRHVNELMDTFRESGRYIRREVDPVIIQDTWTDDSDSSAYELSEDESDRRDLPYDEELEFLTDEELDAELEESDGGMNADVELETIRGMIEERAREQKTRWKAPLHCSCKNGCSNKQCGCNKVSDYCNPSCKCGDNCNNRRQLVPGFVIKRSASGPADPGPSSADIALPPAEPVLRSSPRRKKKAKSLTKGFCSCTSKPRGSCTNGNCVCYAARQVCTANCKCKAWFCQNKDAKKLQHLPPRNAFRMRISDPGPSTSGPGPGPGSSSPFDFND